LSIRIVHAHGQKGMPWDQDDGGLQFHRFGR
jgi:hypothetical protein